MEDKRTPIDKALKRLEDIGDCKGLHLEDVEGYIELCAFLTELEISGSCSDGFSRADCLTVLKRCITYILPVYTANPMEWFNRTIGGYYN